MEETQNGAKTFLSGLKKILPKGTSFQVDATKEKAREKFSTGSLSLDIALGGGHVKGTHVEFFGMNQSSKTTSCLEAAANFQKKYPDELIVFIDLEDTYSKIYCESLGIDTSSENFIVLDLKSGEQTFDTVIHLCKETKGGLVIIDSVSLMLPEKEDEQDMGAHQMGAQGRLMSQGFRKLMAHQKMSGTTFFWINQVRDTFDPYKPIATPGGKALGFYTRCRLYLSRVKGDDPENLQGINIKLEKATFASDREGTTVKTHRIPKGKFAFLKELVDEASSIGIVERAGSWYSYDGTKIGQGYNSVITLLEDNPELVDEIRDNIYAHYGIKN